MLRKELCGRQALHDVKYAIRIKANTVNMMVNQPSCKSWTIRRGLPTNAAMSACLMGTRYSLLDHFQHGRVLFVETICQYIGIAINAEGELGQIVRAYGEAVEQFRKLIDEDDVTWDFAHHVYFEAILAAVEAAARQYV